MAESVRSMTDAERVDIGIRLHREQVEVMRAAYRACRYGDGAEAGMRVISNHLAEIGATPSAKPTPLPAASEAAVLDQAKRAELIVFHGQQCNRVVNGYCGTGRCLKRGGYSGAGSVDYAAATCEAWETIQALCEPATPAAEEVEHG